MRSSVVAVCPYRLMTFIFQCCNCATESSAMTYCKKKNISSNPTTSSGLNFVQNFVYCLSTLVFESTPDPAVWKVNFVGICRNYLLGNFNTLGYFLFLEFHCFSNARFPNLLPFSPKLSKRKRTIPFFSRMQFLFVCLFDRTRQKLP